MDLITASGARDLVAAGAVKGATVVALPEGGYELRITAGQSERVLATKEGKQRRRYANIDTAATHLRALGFSRAELDLAELALGPTQMNKSGRQRKLAM